MDPTQIQRVQSQRVQSQKVDPIQRVQNQRVDPNQRVPIQVRAVVATLVQVMAHHPVIQMKTLEVSV